MNTEQDASSGADAARRGMDDPSAGVPHAGEGGRPLRVALEDLDARSEVGRAPLWQSPHVRVGLALSTAALVYAIALLMGGTPSHGATETEELARLSDAQKKEPCDRTKIVQLTAGLLGNGDARRAIAAGESFLGACGEHEGVRRVLYRAHNQLSDWTKAAQQASSLLALDPVSAEYFGWRGFALEQAGDLEGATTDLQQSLFLRPDFADVAFTLADVLERKGDPCAAAMPLEHLELLHGHKPGAERLRTRIEGLRGNGECAKAATGRAKISLSAGQKAIYARTCFFETKCGVFIVDTGATLVALSGRFAKRVGISFTGGPTVKASTANGVTEGHVVMFDSVAVQGARATHVAAVVLDNLEVDGLLGMTFLSRFDVRQTQGLLEITERTKKEGVLRAE